MHKNIHKNTPPHPQKARKKIPPSQKSRILKMKTKKCLKERKEHQNELRY